MESNLCAQEGQYQEGQMNEKMKAAVIRNIEDSKSQKLDTAVINL